MADYEAEAALRSRERDGFLYPAYDGYCFGRVPATVADRFGVDLPIDPLPSDALAGVETDGVSTVVLLLVDGLRWDRFADAAGELPFFDRLVDRGAVRPLTSIYPSETAAALTTLHTGRYPVEHGLLGWNAYDERRGVAYETLPFRTRGDRPAEEAGVDPDALFEGRSLYDRLGDAGVESAAVVPESIVDTAYSNRGMSGAEQVPYGTVADFGVELRERVEAADGPTHCYGYLPEIDTLSHRFGTRTARYGATLEMIGAVLRRTLLERVERAAAERTLVLLTADHGHLDVEPGVGVDPFAVDGVRDCVRRGPNGDPVPPTGGPRNVHLHLRDGTAERVRSALESELDVRAFTRGEALERELFGPGTPSETFLRACGDVVAVHRDRPLWPDDRKYRHAGVHGGLHPDEMLVPFAAARLSELG